MSNKMVVALTGSSGFVGSHVLSHLVDSGAYEVLSLSRKPLVAHPEGVVHVPFSLGDSVESVLAEKACSVVIHCAARAHIMSDETQNPLAEYRKVNVEGTYSLALQAAKAGVKRFIFISSIKVNGEQTQPGSAYTADDVPAPIDPYGVSKAEAEQKLLDLAKSTGLEVVIIRPPLVYGPGVKGNFATLQKLVVKSLPLPFGAVHNQRSLVSIDNLVDLILTCIHHVGAKNQIFLVSDGQDMSTTELFKELSVASGGPSRLVPVPVGMMTFCALILGKKNIAQRLFGSLQVDISKTRSLLNWNPPLSVQDGLKRCFSKK